jgi:hypothetical protein
MKKTVLSEIIRLFPLDKTEELERVIKEHLPSGSGFDNGTTLDFSKSTPVIDKFCRIKKIVFSTSFHHMNEHGSYDGWTEHNVIITPDWHGFHLRVTGKDKNGIKDYIADCFHNALMKEL